MNLKDESMIFRNILILLYLFSLNLFSLSTITNMDFRQTGDVSRLTFTSNGDFEISKSELSDNKQIVLTLNNVDASSATLRPINTSEFSGSTVYVSAVKESGDQIKVVVQLRENVQSRIEKNGDKTELLIENRFGAFQDGVIDSPSADPIYAPDPIQDIVDSGAPVEDVIENFSQASGKRYIGSPISINVKSVPIVDVMNMIAETSGFNIILSGEASRNKNISLSLNNVPWDEALDTILTMNDLVAKKHGSVLQVITKAKFVADTKKQLEENEVIEQEAPLETRVFTVNHGEIDEVRSNLEQFQTKGRGSISTDKRSNKIIVKDTAENISKMTRIIDLLDIQVPQVLIEARIVEASESLDRSLGFSTINGTYRARPTVSQVGSSAEFDFNTNPAANLLSGSITIFKRLVNLDFNLQLAETERKAKIISSPRIITKHKKTATISTSEQTSYETKIALEGGLIETDYQPITADLILNVTPQVSQDGTIELDIDLKKESFGSQVGDAPPDKSSNEIKTNVVVENGSTIVIGGIYETSESSSHGGVPFLRKIPVIGWLLGTNYRPSKRRKELIIFITPRVVNDKNVDYAEVIN